MKIEELREYKTICTCRSFSAAAEKLFISRYALMRSVAKLESELGGHLFARSSGGIQMTVLGEQTLQCVNNILAEYEAMLKLPDKLRSNVIQVNVGCYTSNSSSYALIRCAETFNEFSAAYKANYHECLQSALLDGLANGEFDLAFTLAPPEGGHFSFVPIISIKQVALVRTDSAYAARGCITYDELYREKLVMPALTGGTLRVMKRYLGEDIGDNVLLQSNDINWLYQQIADNALVGVFGVRDAGVAKILFPSLTTVEITPEVSTKLGLVYKNTAPLRDAERKFIDHVKKNFGKWFCG